MIHYITIQWHNIPIQLTKSTKTKHVKISSRTWQHICVTIPTHVQYNCLWILLEKYHHRILSHHLIKTTSIIDSNPHITDHSRAYFEQYKHEALDFCTQKVIHWNQSLWRKYNSITVKSLKTKWWSCSSKGNLNFNYKLLFLPEWMADYIIVHELCHLQEMNHWPKFRQLVEKIYGPERRKRNKMR